MLFQVHSVKRHNEGRQLANIKLTGSNRDGCNGRGVLDNCYVINILRRQVVFLSQGAKKDGARVCQEITAGARATAKAATCLDIYSSYSPKACSTLWKLTLLRRLQKAK